MFDNDKTDFELLVTYSADILCRVGLDRVLLYVSPSCVPILGWKQEEMIGKGPEAFVFAEDIPAVRAAFSRVCMPEAQNLPTTVRTIRKDGSTVWMETNARLVRDVMTGMPKEVVLIIRDITEHRILEDKLAAMAFSDGLTGLLNRRAISLPCSVGLRAADQERVVSTVLCAV